MRWWFLNRRDATRCSARRRGAPHTPGATTSGAIADPLARLPYYQTHAFTAHVGGYDVRVVSKPGLPHWDQITPATMLLADAAAPDPASDMLVLGCGHGALGVSLARQAPAGSVRMMDPNVAALAMAQRTIQANAVAHAAVAFDMSLLPAQAEAFDIVVMEPPPNRRLGRRWLLEAHGALRAGGRLYVAGPNNAGIQSLIDDARALFGNATVLGYKAKNRVARAAKDLAVEDRPSWAREPGIAPATWHEFDITVDGETLHLYSLPGVFSYDRLDEGTRLLLARLHQDGLRPEGARVLDIGCGNGVIGLVAARRGAACVDMIDVDLLAVAAAEKNVASHGVSNARVLASDALAAVSDRCYDLVLSNPPFHAGKVVDYAVARTFIEHARYILEPDGKLVVVANKFIRYDRLMSQFFEQVGRLAETPSYHVLLGT